VTGVTVVGVRGHLVAVEAHVGRGTSPARYAAPAPREPSVRVGHRAPPPKASLGRGGVPRQLRPTDRARYTGSTGRYEE
jgi:hypothetical protein